MNLGLKGSGKSALLETLACHYPKIVDLFGSRDSEGLAWCRSHLKDSVLFVVGDSIEISSDWPSIPVSKVCMSDFQDYKVILSCHCFYSSGDEEFQGLNKILYDVLYHRVAWSEVWFLMVREAANFIYSRIKISKNQSVAKADFIYLLREVRHMGYSIGVDTIRWTSIDKEVRDVSDYVFIKKVGVLGLPRDISFIYRYIEPMSLMNPKPWQFLLLSNDGPIGVGRFTKPYWHKEEKENLMRKLNIQIKYGEIPFQGSTRVLSDFDHLALIKEYQHTKNFSETGRNFGRSAHTVSRHIANHNKEVLSREFCRKCRRVKSELATQIIEVPMISQYAAKRPYISA